MPNGTLAALIDLHGGPITVGWGWIQVSIGNLVALGAVATVVAVALLGGRSDA